MTVQRIESLDDQRLQPYRDLRGKRTARELGLFVVEGALLVERLVRSDLQVHSLLVEEHRIHHLPGNLDPDTTVFVVPRGTASRVVGFRFHRGVLGCGVRPSAREPDFHIRASTAACPLVVCDAISDPENLGGVLRNAAAFGAPATILGPGCSDPFSRRVARTSMGTVFDLPLFLTSDLPAALRRLAASGVIPLATVLDQDAESLPACRCPSTSAIVLGSEGRGLAPDVRSVCQRRVTLPMEGRVDSLNVATASALFLYHFTFVQQDVGGRR